MSQVLDLFKGSGSAVLLFAAALLTALAARIFLMLGINNDAKSRAITSRVLWVALTFFFPICAVVVYRLARGSLRTDAPKFCSMCGAASPPNSVTCQSCGASGLTDYKIDHAEKFRKRVKPLIIIGIVLYLAGSLGTSAAVGKFRKNLMKNAYTSYGQEWAENQEELDELRPYLEWYLDLEEEITEQADE